MTLHGCFMPDIICLLLQLLRNPAPDATHQVRQHISEIADKIFQAVTDQVSELDSSQQQLLVLELSQLGVVFISPEWHDCCPPVPVPLLNSLLDSLLQRLRTLHGGQVGMLLLSLQRLQLCDSDAYGFILKEIDRQLQVSKENSWYRQLDHLGKLVRGVVTVFLVSGTSVFLLSNDYATCIKPGFWALLKQNSRV